MLCVKKRVNFGFGIKEEKKEKKVRKEGRKKQVDIEASNPSTKKNKNKILGTLFFV